MNNPTPEQIVAQTMKNIWKGYAADFNSMTDAEIEAESEQCLDQVSEAESWLEAVAAWEAAGKPRAICSHPCLSPVRGGSESEVGMTQTPEQIAPVAVLAARGLQITPIKE